MRINSSTNYAIKMLICLSRSLGVIPSNKLSQEIGVSSRYLLQIGSKLKAAGLIETHHGSTGGYTLAKSPSEIDLLSIIKIMEASQSKSVSVVRGQLDAIDAEYQCIYQKIDDILSRFTIEKLALKQG